MPGASSPLYTPDPNRSGNTETTDGRARAAGGRTRGMYKPAQGAQAGASEGVKAASGGLECEPREAKDVWVVSRKGRAGERGVVV